MLQYFRERHVSVVSGQAPSAPGAAPARDFSGALDAARERAVLAALMPDTNSPPTNELRIEFNPSEIRLPVDKSLRSPEAGPAAAPRLSTNAAAANLPQTVTGQQAQGTTAALGPQDAMTAEEESRLTAQAQNDLLAIARRNAKRLLAERSQAGETKPERIKDLDPVQNLPPAEQLLSAARSLLGRPYRSGGESPRAGFDCSGFTSYVYGKCGVELPRNSRQQFTEGREIAPSELKKGDLVFFGHKKHISHVGIYVGDGKFIHSGSESGHVKISDLSDPYWQGRLAGCRRLL
jgi:cell wall-associated NlpC family hydrolase